MLTDLLIKNLSLIERLELEFHPGLTVLTGETGAGKSILLEALMLIMGERASIEQIREGSDDLEVMAGFTLDETTLQKTNQILGDLGLSALDDSSLIVRKVVARHGRHKQFVNGMPVTLGQLRELASPLIDLTSQHAQQSLLQAKGQLALLDAFAGHDDLLAAMSDAYRQFQSAKQKLASVSLDERTRLTRIDWLQFQIDEISRINPKAGELEALSLERDRLNQVGRLQDEAKRAIELLTDSDRGQDTLASVQQASHILKRSAKHHEALEEMSRSLLDAASLIDDVARELDRYLAKLQANPERLNQIDERLFELQRLVRKQGTSLDDVFAGQVAMTKELNELEGMAESLAAYNADLKTFEEHCHQLSIQLTKSRREAAGRFSNAVKQELRDLGMPQVVFDIELTNVTFTTSGANQIRILFSANPGEPPQSLEKIASGGELSRVMLAIKRVLLTRDLTLVSIFDEVDAGVGGAMGEAIGEKLQVIAQGRQVLCVTHLAQVAARADVHLKVEKQIIDNRTVTTVTTLNDESRVEELARMIGGRQLTELSRKHAEEFLERAHA
jgi:DNA repair protein RecN (Recombination protein N)